MGATFPKSLFPMFSTNHKPLIVVLGVTGAGKSKLALEIATKVNGEIVSADAMQVYKGLDIVTNKVTKEELKLCPHHMIGLRSPRERFNVVDYQQEALTAIDDIHSRQKLPILVGGTNYYVESILFDFLIRTKICDSEMTADQVEYREELNKLSDEEVHKRLTEIDPTYAVYLHPKDKRKTVRALEVFHQTGKLMSELIANQKLQSGSSHFGGPLRFPNTCCLWVQCEPDALKERVFKRVDKMVSRGLLKELSDFHHEYNKERLQDGKEPDYESGIFQSIGFKEFHSFLTSPSADPQVKESMLLDAIEKMKLSTWQYAKYQKKWITKRIVNRPVSVPVYALDATEPELWERNVLAPSLKVLKLFFRNHSPVSATLDYVVDEEIACPVVLEKQIVSDIEKRRILRPCNVCEGKLIGEFAWKDHIKSKKHKHHYRKWIAEMKGTCQILESRRDHLEYKMRNEKSQETIGNQKEITNIVEHQPIPWETMESEET